MHTPYFKIYVGLISLITLKGERSKLEALLQQSLGWGDKTRHRHGYPQKIQTTLPMETIHVCRKKHDVNETWWNPDTSIHIVQFWFLICFHVLFFLKNLIHYWNWVHDLTCIPPKNPYYCSLQLFKHCKNTAVLHHSHSLSLRVISTASTVAEMLSLLDLMSFRTAQFNSCWNSPRWADVKPFKTEEGIDTKLIAI